MCAAQVLVCVSDAAARQEIIAQIGPQLDRAVRAGRNQPDLVIPKNHDLILPH